MPFGVTELLEPMLATVKHRWCKLRTGRQSGVGGFKKIIRPNFTEDVSILWTFFRNFNNQQRIAQILSVSDVCYTDRWSLV